jgi:hypothetical protein
MFPLPRRLLLTTAIALISRSPAIADPPAAGTVQWSGRTWTIRDDTGGPGPNTFAPGNVTIAADGSLHLKLQPTNGKWTCAEIYTSEPLGRGTYVFNISTPVDSFDPSITLGLFSYPKSNVGPDGTNELDIEFARWGNAKYPNGNYTAWPVDVKQKNVDTTFEFEQTQDETEQVYTWADGSVTFETLEPVEKKKPRLIRRWTTPDKFAALVAKKPMPVHINLWLFGGHAPTDGKAVEVVIKSFKFTPEK